MVLGDFNAHHLSWNKKDDRAAARGKALHGAVNSLQLAVANQDLPTQLPSQGQPSSPDITLLSGHFLPDATWSTHTTLGSDHLPIGQPSPSPITPRPHRGKNVPLRTFASLTGRDLQQRQRGNSPIPLYQPPALLEKKSSGLFLAKLEDTTSPVFMLGTTAALSLKVVRPLISLRYQLRTDDPLDPAIKLVDQDIQRHIRQEAQDHWRSLLESSDCSSNPERYWSFLRKLGGMRSSPPPNISIDFDGKTQSSTKVIARAFNRQFTACSAQQDRAIRRLMRDLLH